jgi:hypothetical protein
MTTVVGALERVIQAEVVLLVAVALALGPTVAAARGGHTSGMGDCWQGHTPKLCRSNWAALGGANHALRLRIINETTTALWQRAVTAGTNWNNAPGPTSISSSARTNDSWIFVETDNSLLAPNGVTRNFRADGTQIFANVAGIIHWSEVGSPEANLFCGTCAGGAIATRVWAHEYGHAQGLEHHDADVLMRQNTTKSAPTVTDIGANPPCSPSPQFDGMRCIYNYGL